MNIYLSICNYNARDKLKETLDSVYKAKPLDNDTKVSIVDNNSQDGSVDVIKEYSFLDLVLYRDTNVGKAIAINELVKQTNDIMKIKDDDLIFSLDSDITLVTDNFFKRVMEIWPVMEKHVSCLVCTQTGNSLCKRSFEWTDSNKGFHYFVPSEGYGFGIAGGAMITPYKYWKKIGGYREQLGIYGGNDGNALLDLYTKISKPITVIKDLEVFHFEEENKEYQKWKDDQHQSMLSIGRSFSAGFFDDTL